ncbi:lipid-A-disaccharide synthase [Sneathiella limimaris]|uniref:lipid-A-disaccharide synthase n=1 Tax=Sneathiella limimaris TaxID=1964213 RepID=UPI00146A74EA|nr:lipid-A-disaccharide synthase [Sneathiella limimaris]
MDARGTDQKQVTFFLIAGEPSGDVLGARLMSAIKSRLPDTAQARFYGVGGPLMLQEGLKSLFPMEELTVMGVAEVIPNLGNLLRRIRQTAKAARTHNPDAFISIDAPDFSFRVAAKLQGVNFPKLHYVAPSVWAWRPGRAKKIAALYDHLLTLLPFEPPYFEKEGLDSTFVGHSILDSGADNGDYLRFRSKFPAVKEDPILMVLPGSRRSEVTRHLPIFQLVVQNLSTKHSDLKVVMPIVGKSAEIVRETVENWSVPVTLIDNEQDKYDAMAAAKVALAASGTVGLELALAKLPSVIAYRMHPITAFLAKRLIKLDYVNLVNILLKSEIVPEYLLDNCRAELLVPALETLLSEKSARQKQLKGYNEAVQLLQEKNIRPADKAAKTVLEVSSIEV